MKRDLKKYYSDYSNHQFEDVQEKFRRKKIIEFISKYKPRSIIEVGCGRNSIFNSLDLNNYDFLYSIEPIKELIECNESIKDKVNFIESRVEDTKINLQADFIVLSSILHEVEDKDLLIKRIKNMMYHNSIVHINVPNALSLHRLIAYEAGLIKSLFQISDTQQKMQQNIVFSLETIKEFLIKHNFHILDSGSYFIKPFTHNQMHQISKFIPNEIYEGLFNVIKYFPDYGSEIFINVNFRDSFKK